MKRIMGIDFGDARTGVAMSDLLCSLVGSTAVVPSRNVEKAIAGVQGIESVHVDLTSATASIKGDASISAIKEAVESIGFEVDLSKDN